MTRKLIGILTCALFLLALSPFSARAAAAWKVLINGTPSKLAVIDEGGESRVPLYFTVPESGAGKQYSVRIERGVGSREIKITTVEKKRPVRDPGDCPKCEGSEDCQSCYPAGSGVNTSGGPCYYCNATGDCAYCSGSGDCYSCGGAGFSGGCNTCGKVSSY